MSDLKFSETNTASGIVGIFDMKIEDGDFATDSGLENAVLLSLFLDARADDDDELPDLETDRRGWWGDEFFGGEDEDHIGSKLWLIAREKQTDDILELANRFSEESLQWMIDDGVTDRVTVTSTFGENSINLKVEIAKPDDEDVIFEFSLNWESLANGV